MFCCLLGMYVVDMATAQYWHLIERCHANEHFMPLRANTIYQSKTISQFLYTLSNIHFLSFITSIPQVVCLYSLGLYFANNKASLLLEGLWKIFLAKLSNKTFSQFLFKWLIAFLLFRCKNSSPIYFPLGRLSSHFSAWVLWYTKASWCLHLLSDVLFVSGVPCHILHTQYLLNTCCVRVSGISGSQARNLRRSCLIVGQRTGNQLDVLAWGPEMGDQNLNAGEYELSGELGWKIIATYCTRGGTEVQGHTF